jgi:hypothetical protein
LLLMEKDSKCLPSTEFKSTFTYKQLTFNT